MTCTNLDPVMYFVRVGDMVRKILKIAIATYTIICYVCKK